MGIGTSFDFQRKTLDLIVDAVRRLRYCDGVTDGDYKTTLKYIREQVTKVGEYTNRMRCRAKTCATILSFTAINLTCYNCNMICKPSQSLLESESNDENENVTLSENDHTDLSDILKTVFPECNLKISTFLCSQKMALERDPHGRRWSKDIIRMYLTLWCRSPRGYTDLRNSGFIVLPSQKILQNYKNIVHQEAGINKEILQLISFG